MEEIRILRNYAMGTLIKKYAANGQFFTNEEFEKHKGEILHLGGALRKVSEALEEKGNFGQRIN
jgi:hypothetical protein